MGGHARIGIRHPVAPTHGCVDPWAKHVGIDQAFLDTTDRAVGVHADAATQRPRAIFLATDGPGVNFPHQVILDQASHGGAIQHRIFVGQQHRDKQGVGQRKVKPE